MTMAADRASSDIDVPIDPALQDLRKAYESGQLVVFAGAGVSAAAGLPGWQKLTEQMVARLRVSGARAVPACLHAIAKGEIARSTGA
ncbi:hypothetical protein [Sorangium atrum]|uniref:Deacetylase sirtuin-type domain-containing protein n=1 Tax=Sorangium atrum TaxID=2995308 RepID=A0ABT5BS50_9BACT|nr:hypothetical protein [Sorangium aterium]MDC0676995.1 hypothetical protein [Sorangium aterium]